MLTESSDVRAKIEALKRVIIMILNGEKMQSLLMTVIRFVMPQQDHTIKKLLLIFWEVVPKYTADGKMMQEMILVCDAYRKVHYNTIAVYCPVNGKFVYSFRIKKFIKYNRDEKNKTNFGDKSVFSRIL